VVEAKPADAPLTGVEWQSDKYVKGFPQNLAALTRPLPYVRSEPRASLQLFKPRTRIQMRPVPDDPSESGSAVPPGHVFPLAPEIQGA
jgi:hypothetical protein